jgi:hypothetical protein
MQDSISLNFYIASNPDWQQNSQDGINSMTVPTAALPHCRAAAHFRAHCHALPIALTHTAVHTACTLLCALPHNADRTARTAAMPRTAAQIRSIHMNSYYFI